MPDRILLIVFGTLSTLGLLVGALGVYFAMKSARKQDGEIGMALWSMAALAGFTVAGMCWAYFLVPILMNHLSN